MYDTILVPTDGSAAAETATESALGLARQFDAEVRAIHVVDRGELPADVEAEAASELISQGEAALSKIEVSAVDAGVDSTTDLVETTGSIHREIVEYALDHGVDAIVMGTHGRTGVDQHVLGSVAERTIRVAPMPVLTVRGDAGLDPDVETILVPTDGSDVATAAADHAIDLAAATDASLHVVHVVHVPTPKGAVDSGTVLAALEEAGQRAVDEVIDRAEEADLRSIEASVLSGTPARAILDYADDRPVDLVVMGTHGRTGLDRYLLGSVTEKVVRTAEIPVLTVSEESADEE